MQVKSLREARQCKLCLDLDAAVLFDPCGHICTCVNCSQAVGECPMCRTAIRRKIRAYM